MSQMYQLPSWQPPMEVFCRMGPIFELEDDKEFSMAKAIDAIEGQMFARKMELSNGRVGSSETGGEENREVRRSKVYFVEPSKETEFIFHRIGMAVARANWDKFDMDLDYLETLQYTLYEESENGTYHWHIDSHVHGQRQLHRKISIVMGVNDPSEYEGGDLVLNIGGDPDKAISLRLAKGEAVLFYSNIPHYVTPVTKGERYTLVSWVLGPKVR